MTIASYAQNIQMQMQSSICVHIDAETYIYIDMLAFADTFLNTMQLACIELFCMLACIEPKNIAVCIELACIELFCMLACIEPKNIAVCIELLSIRSHGSSQ